MFILEGFIKKGTVPNLTLKQLESRFKDYCKTKMVVASKNSITLPLNDPNPTTQLILTWDNKWSVSISFIDMNENDMSIVNDFRQKADDLAKVVAKESSQKAEIIKNADRVLRVVRISDDQREECLSWIGIGLLETLVEWTGCVFVSANTKKLFL